MSRSDVTARIRSYLLTTLVIGLLGTGTELLLLGHVESVQQRIPLVLLAVGLVAGVWHAMRPTRATVRMLQTVMVLCVLSGIIGVGLHAQGNEAFELEMYPAMHGRELAAKVLTGATPVLAPGSMVLLGLIGLTHTYRHPSIDPDAEASFNQEGDA
jgi:hypothetical protein